MKGGGGRERARREGHLLHVISRASSNTRTRAHTHTHMSTHTPTPTHTHTYKHMYTYTRTLERAHTRPRVCEHERAKTGH
jgi:hypothetical protein